MSKSLNTEEVGFTEKEKQFIEEFRQTTLDSELNQALELDEHCNNAFQYAKTYSNYVKDWEQVQSKLDTMFRQGMVHESMSSELAQRLKEVYQEVIDEKLNWLRTRFEIKFNESFIII